MKKKHKKEIKEKCLENLKEGMDLFIKEIIIGKGRPLLIDVYSDNMFDVIPGAKEFKQIIKKLKLKLNIDKELLDILNDNPEIGYVESGFMGVFFDKGREADFIKDQIHEFFFPLEDVTEEELPIEKEMLELSRNGMISSLCSEIDFFYEHFNQ